MKKRHMKKILLVVYILASILFCYAVYIDNDMFRTVTKPIPLIILLFLLKPNSKYKKLIFIGFIFSLFGDIFLMNIIDKFIFGLASFLIAHIFYIIAFSKRYKQLNIISAIPFYVFAGILIFFFYPYLGNMKFPVIIYIIVIVTMLWRAFLQRNFDNFAIFALIGAILFAISDTNIAFTKFIQDYDYSKIVTIVFYWTAQFLIYKSTIKHKVTQ